MQTLDFNKYFQTWINKPFITSETNISYSQFLSILNQTIKKLSKIGINTGEKVGIIAETNESFLILFLAMLHTGVIPVPLNNKIPKKQILQMLYSINCYKLFVNTTSEWKKFDSSIMVFQIDEFIPDVITETTIDNLGLIFFQQDSSIIFTSGSIGNPKAVVHTFGNHYFSAKGSNENIPFKPGDRWLLSLPLYHVGGLSILFRAIVGGGAVVIPDENLSLLENIKKYKVTHISLVTTQLIKLLEINNSFIILKKLKCILVGGSFIPPELIKQSIENHLPIFTTYGSTEMASQVTTTKTNEFSEKLYTSGKLLQHRKIKIAQDREILSKGKTLFKGFLEKDLLIKSFDSDGWYRTGDLGTIDNEGYLSIIGRKDNMFISGGENIYPEEIEKYLMNLDGIKEAIVLDLPSEEFGSRPIASIKANNYDLLSRTKITKLLSQHLPKFKIPDAFYKWPESQNTIKPNRNYFNTLYNNRELEEIE